MCILIGCKTWLIPASTIVIVIGGEKAYSWKAFHSFVKTCEFLAQRERRKDQFTSESELRKSKQDNMLRTICFLFPAKCLLTTTRKKWPTGTEEVHFRQNWHVQLKAYLKQQPPCPVSHRTVCCHQHISEPWGLKGHCCILHYSTLHEDILLLTPWIICQGKKKKKETWKYK